MITLVIGLIILIGGGILYGRLCEKVFSPDDRQTPAYKYEDGVDFVPMKKWRNSLINLLNIAGTGPILGPIQGILFGPIAFITIPIGCILGGAIHDYFTGMISTREGGIQMPEMIRRHHSKGIFRLFLVFIMLLLFLCIVVFVYTPGDIISTQLLGFKGSASELSTWIIYGFIILYYLIAAVLPINKIIGKIYPVFGMLLIVSSIGIFIMLILHGYKLCEIWGTQTLGGFDFGEYFRSGHFIPVFFITVACGIMSGFHSSQTVLVSRTIQSEKHGRMVFFDTMICEGFIAMVWAAGTMAVIGIGADKFGITMQLTDAGWGYFQSVGGTLQQISPTSVVGVICKSMLGNVGFIFAVLGVIVLPISTADTALRSLRLMISETFHIKQQNSAQRMMLTVFLLSFIVGILIWAKRDANGFNVLWRYFGWINQTISVFTTSSIMIYLMRHGKAKYAWMPAIPFIFYSFVISTFILSNPIGFSLSMKISYIIGGIFTLAVLAAALRQAGKSQTEQ